MFMINKDLKEVTLSNFLVTLIQDQEFGRGAYGRVFKARHCGVLYTAKEIHPSLVDDAYTTTERKGFRTTSFVNVIISSELMHINIVHFVNILSSSTITTGDDHGIDG